jgi:PAS domain-containing protein
MAKRVRKTLVRGSEGKYEHLFANTLDGMLVFDAETMKVVLVNQAAAGITGFGSPRETGIALLHCWPTCCAGSEAL